MQNAATNKNVRQKQKRLTSIVHYITLQNLNREQNIKLVIPPTRHIYLGCQTLFFGRLFKFWTLQLTGQSPKLGNMWGSIT